MKSSLNRWTALVLSTLFAFVACQGVEPEGGTGTGPENMLVKPVYNKTKVLKNPLTGWVMYGSGSGDPSYWDTSFYVDEKGANVRVRDYASAAYIRTYWAAMNPAEGVYAWRDPSTAIYKMIHGALDRGLPIAFRFNVDGRDQRRNTPKFVTDAGAVYGVENDKFPDRITPMPQDPVFQRYYEQFLTALAEDFNDPGICAFIDGYGLGKWGEGHTVAYDPDDLTRVDENTVKLKEDVMNWITRAYASRFTKVPLVLNYHRSVGHPTDGTQPDSERLVSIAVSNGYSLRSDAFGMNSYYGTWEKGIVNTWRYKRPVIMEGGWIVGQHSYWNDPAGYRRGHPEDVRKGEFDASKEARVNMMDFRVGEETQSWFTDAFTLVQQFVSEGGYRVYPDQVSLPAEVKSGTTVKIGSRWRNMGWGYLPNNIPQWDYKYKVAFALLDKSDRAVKVWVDQACEPSVWVESKPFSYDFSFQVDVPAGPYHWAVAIVDTSLDDTPGIELAVNDETTAEGWVKLLSVTVK
ncbi:MAG: DUF4832 domain-containing protein [Bacteroidales bacterium]|nr:DUF4832 domain-containing protein [Bacteroidales bacterium]